ncbi:TPA: hypothetical protein VDU70_003515 [Pseudomonas aeruginosa]|nr:hypothetical protein [Pseudomonas aeruginosa]HEP8853231.1 hypothetical protein [Pseudomonas aeruginosa]
MSQKTQPDSMPDAEAVDLPEISVEHSTEFLTGSAPCVGVSRPLPAAWLGQRGIYRSRFEAVCNGEQLVDPLTLGELIQRAWPSPSTELAERGTQHRFSTTEQTCRHDFYGVWWNDSGVTKTGRECRHCGFFVADMTEAAAEQAGGDERAAFELFVRKHCGMPAHIAVNWDAKFTNDAWAGWQARAALAQPSQSQYEASFEEWLANELEGEDGQPVPAAVCDITLARRAFNHWPKLEQPAKVGGVRFSAGVSSRLVVEAAQRLYEFESTPEQEAERIERLQAFREQCFEPLGTEFSKVLSENLVELSSDAKPEQADEKPGDSILCYGCFAKGVGPDHFDEAGKCLAAQAEATQGGPRDA